MRLCYAGWDRERDFSGFRCFFLSSLSITHNTRNNNDHNHHNKPNPIYRSVW